MTTRGHELKYSWKDGTLTWIQLKDLNESYPIETTQYSSTMDLVQSPAFKWWILQVLRKCDQIISKLQQRLIKKNSKYEHVFPSSAKEAYKLDRKHHNTRWKDAITK